MLDRAMAVAGREIQHEFLGGDIPLMLCDKNHQDWKQYYGGTFEEVEAEGDHADACAVNEILEGCKVELVDRYGGEGQGDTYYAVYKVTTPDGEVKHYQVDGWYASYDGSSYSDTFEVEPREVMKIEWTKI